MKQLKKSTQKKLNWFLIPFGIFIIIFFIDLVQDKLENYLEWGRYALLASLDLYIIAFAIACIREKCWALLILAIFLFLWTLGGVVMSDNLFF